MSTRVSQRIGLGASLNGSRSSSRIETRNPGAGVTVRATTISFSSSGTIADSGNGLGQFPAGARVRVTGSPKNSGLYQVSSGSAGSLSVIPAKIQNESAGAVIQLVREG